MKFAIYLNILLIIVHPSNGKDVPKSLDDYVRLIKDVRDYYTASAVFLVHPLDEYKDYRDLRITYLVHTMMRILGRSGIATINVHFHRMYRVTRYYTNTVRPLIVVLLSGLNEVEQFSNVTETFKMSFPAWLLIFLPSNKHKENEYCQEPDANLFHLTFNTDMLVICPNDNAIREWYSIDGNSTVTGDMGFWDPIKGLTILNNLSLFQRRNNLRGLSLRAVVVKNSPFFELVDGQLRGMIGEIVRELSEAINLTFTVVKETKTYGTWNAKTRSWSGAANELVSGRADIGISEFTMISRRLDALDFTIPLILTRSSLFIRQSDIFGVQWFAYFQTFSYTVWMCIIAVIIVTPFILVYIGMYVSSCNLFQLVSDNFLYVWGIFCQQTLTDFPENASLRLAYTSTFCAALVISAAYSASLISFLTTSIRILPFRSVDEFIEDGSYKLLLLRDSADYDMFVNAEDPFSKDMASLIPPPRYLPRSVIEGFRRICENPSLVLYTAEAVTKKISAHVPCDISVIGTGRIDSLSLVLTKNNPYTAILNYHLQKFLHNGMLSRFKAIYPSVKSDGTKKFQPVELVSVTPLLAILGGGVILGIVILCMEKCYYYYKTRKV